MEVHRHLQDFWGGGGWGVRRGEERREKKNTWLRAHRHTHIKISWEEQIRCNLTEGIWSGILTEVLPRPCLERWKVDLSWKAHGIDLLKVGRVILRLREQLKQAVCPKKGASVTGSPSMEEWCFQALFFFLWFANLPWPSSSGYLSSTITWKNNLKRIIISTHYYK